MGEVKPYDQVPVEVRVFFRKHLDVAKGKAVEKAYMRDELEEDIMAENHACVYGARGPLIGSQIVMIIMRTRRIGMCRQP